MNFWGIVSAFAILFYICQQVICFDLWWWIRYFTRVRSVKKKKKSCIFVKTDLSWIEFWVQTVHWTSWLNRIPQQMYRLASSSFNMSCYWSLWVISPLCLYNTLFRASEWVTERESQWLVICTLPPWLSHLCWRAAGFNVSLTKKALSVIKFSFRSDLCFFSADINQLSLLATSVETKKLDLLS